MPHARKAGKQTQLLKARLDAVPDAGLIVMIAPPNPYRCPPGPYERVSMMAHVLKAAGRTKARIVIVDPKESFSKQPLFMAGWQKHYPGMIEWLGPKVHDGVKSVDPKSGTVVTGFETYKAALVNVIPAQMAGAIVREAGLANASGFCPIDPASMRSMADPSIFIIGDACIPGDMPKSAFAANSQAKVAAMVVRGELAKTPTFPARYANTCWSLIETDDAVKIGGRYEARDDKIAATPASNSSSRGLIGGCRDGADVLDPTAASTSWRCGWPPPARATPAAPGTPHDQDTQRSCGQVTDICVPPASAIEGLGIIELGGQECGAAVS